MWLDNRTKYQENKNMNNWIPFSDGEYLVEQALLIGAEDQAVSVENVIVEVYSDQRGQRYLRVDVFATS